MVLFLYISHSGFKSEIWLLIAQVPVHCFSITFTIYGHGSKFGNVTSIMLMNILIFVSKSLRTKFI